MFNWLWGTTQGSTLSSFSITNSTQTSTEISNSNSTEMSTIGTTLKGTTLKPNMSSPFLPTNKSVFANKDKSPLVTTLSAANSTNTTSDGPAAANSGGGVGGA